MLKKILFTVALFFSFCLIPLTCLFADDESETEYLRGEILEVLEEDNIDMYGTTQLYQKLSVLIQSGSLYGEIVEIENGSIQSTQVIDYSKGDKVWIMYDKDVDGHDNFYITDYYRNNSLIFFSVLFIVCALIVGRRKGFMSILAMIISFVVIFVYLLPQIQAGKNPVLIVIISSILIIPVTFYLSHGFNRKTTVSIISTFIVLVLTIVLSNIAVSATYLTGSASEEAMFLISSTNINFDLRGILLAGIIIGTLGVLDDITVSQTSIVYQLYDLKKDISFGDLFTRSMQVGKDHIASMINTLVLAYTGASLPLLLLFMNSSRSFSEIIGLEVVSEEVVRTLVGSIGLILAVPITTLLACYFVKKSSI